MGQLVDLNGKAIIDDSKLPQYTNRDLNSLFQEFNRVNRGLMGLMLRSKLRDFYKHNYLRYKTLVERLEALDKANFVFEKVEGAKDRIVIEIIQKDGMDFKQPKLLEGCTMEDYQAKLDGILNEGTVINL